MEEGHLIELWAKYEDVAMHFNDLLMRLRTQALGAVAAIVAVASFVFEGGFGENGTLPWFSICVGLVLLLGAWMMVFMLDAFYYSRLLTGAVDALLDIEKKCAGAIVLSTRIDERFWKWSPSRRRGDPRAAINLAAVLLFYLPVGLTLALLAIFAARDTPWMRHNGMFSHPRFKQDGNLVLQAVHTREFIVTFSSPWHRI